MGFLKMLKESQQTIKEAQKVASAGLAMQQKYQAQQDAANQPFDPNDPRYAPIQGIDVDTYAQIMAGLQKNAVVGPEAVNAYVEQCGVPQGKWQEVQIGWQQRMAQHQEVAIRFGNIMNKFLF